MTLLERIQRKLTPEPNTGCLLWTGAVDRLGYGQIRVAPRGAGSLLYVHRVVFIETKGELPGDLCALHSCDQPSCCEARHLFSGTRIDNNRDMLEKGRAVLQPRRPFCVRGHRLDGENVYVHRRRRYCRPCRQLRLERWRAAA